MKSVGIIAEYNPFHNGHKYHLNRTLELTGADILIVIMSGNFVERGEPALLNKWERAKIAVNEGANLVIELPTVYATSNAGVFAKGSIEILESLKCDIISFGVTSSSSKLVEISNYLRENDSLIKKEIKSRKSEGLNYPKIREDILVSKFGNEIIDIIREPNNILAVEYLKNIKSANPLFIDRYKVYHNDSLKDEFASGSYIRSLINDSKDYSLFLPYDYEFPVNNFKDRLYEQIVFLAMHEDEEQLNSYFGAEEGIGSILKNKYRYWSSYEDILKDLKSKRYTLTRINRTLLNMLLGIKRTNIINAKNYARVLSFDEKGQKYIKELKKNYNTCPIITNINKEITPDIQSTIEFDIKGSDLYNQLSNLDKYKNSDFVIMPSRFYKRNEV